MLKVNVYKDPYDDGVNLYTNTSIELEPGLTLLVGCNGSGKSTFIDTVNKKYRNILCNNESEFILLDSDSRDSYRDGMQTAMMRNDMTQFSSMFVASEGERASRSLNPDIRKLGSISNEAIETGKSVIWTLDASDSGLDCYYIDDILELIELVLKDSNNRGFDIYIIVSINQYEWLYWLSRHTNINYKYVDVRRLRYLDWDEYCPTYELWRFFILDSHNEKEKRYNRIDAKKNS